MNMEALKLILVVCVLLVEVWHNAEAVWVNDANCGTRVAGKKRSLLDTDDDKEHDLAKRIYGGTMSTEGQWPWMTALLRQGYDQWCGGSLISSQWVLTAAHCVDGVDMNEFSVQVGENTLRLNSAHAQTQTISQIIIHEAYSNNLGDPNIDDKHERMRNDIALLRLTNPVNLDREHTNVICLPTSNARIGDHCNAAGWGETEAGRYSEALLHFETWIFTRHTCHENFPDYRARVSEGSFCIDHENGSVDTCYGDSGGPLMCQNRQGMWVQFGVVSWTWACASNTPSVMMDVRHYVDWIDDTVISNGGA